MIAVGHAVDEIQGLIEFLRAVVLRAVNQRVNRIAVERIVVVTPWALGGKRNVAGVDEEFAVRVEQLEQDWRGNPTENGMGKIAETDAGHDGKGRAGGGAAGPLE